MGLCASTQWNVPRRCGPYGEFFFFLLKKDPMVLSELVRLEPSIRPHGELLFFLLMQKKPAFVPDSEAFNSYIKDGFLVPELKGECEASEDEQADSSSANNVSNEALFVIVPARLGGGKGSPELPFCIRYAMPRIIRSGKETWLVWFLSEPVCRASSPRC